MTSDSEKSEPEYLRSYGRRQGKKLRPGRERLMAELLPKIKIVPGQPIAAQFASGVQSMWMEIGFGAGEHLAMQAQAHPDVGLIGCEPFVNGVAKLLSKIDDADIQNIRIHPDDARDIFPDIEDGGLGRIFILFPDPWPKIKHHKRRLIQSRLLDDLARLLDDDGELLFASDHMGYVRWTLAMVLKHRDFEWVCEGPADWRTPPDNWIKTRYEQKALAGDVMVYLRFRRKPRSLI
ncbi:tRNA (guanosine(46)-N7)-methyltransferase TrmB [Magnetovibrio sp. PR-2]|uniref:tRNA (guanosine(46)-N7)-methyltransferase TrmB n=1 Tax=Magnetovibrio sp. PR-2 TaxID=3120356 RepID=UPI002FCDF986